MRLKIALILFICCTIIINAQQKSEQVEGLRVNVAGVYALKNLTIIPEPKNKIENGVIIIRDGIIQSVGKNISIPNDALVIDCKGLTAYPGFIDLSTDYGLPKTQSPKNEVQSHTTENRGAGSWNSNVKPQNSSADNFASDKELAEKLRANGFTSVLTYPSKGIFRGSSAHVLLGEGDPNSQIINSNVINHISFDRDRSEDNYPNSLMGAIALIRQTFIDADWYLKAWSVYEKNPNQNRPEINIALDILNKAIDSKKYFMFETNDELNIFRASKIAKEFSLNSIVRGNGFEYRRLIDIKGLNQTIILPINFPDAPKVETPQEAYDVEYSDLQHWDNAPENPARLQKAGVKISFTTATMKDVSKFLPNLRLAVKRGLSIDDALQALTLTPAKIIGAEKNLGSISTGKIANIILTDGDLFNEKTKIRENWIAGKKYEISSPPQIDLRGKWSFSIIENTNIDTGSIDITGEIESLSTNYLKGNKKVKATTSKIEGKKYTSSFEGDSLGLKGIVRFTAQFENESLLGNGEFANGNNFIFSAKRISQFVQPSDSSKPSTIQNASFEVVYPESPFGRKEIPLQIENLLLKNATIWTSAESGILKETDILISKGKIIQIGKNLSSQKNIVEIDCSGKHISAGLIDAHSHTAISNGVNESGQSITAEVRIADVVNSDDISIYRELAGGLTTANLLHGSANAIGGQNQIIKLRWGALPEEMKFENAMPGIKFALGENPKQSNWGEKFTTRYPQTRMGVEQIIRDDFIAAVEYEKSFQDYKINSNLIPPRRDLELETLVEILNKKRIVHAHSYRQDEILMLARVAKDFKFKIGTFQHVLEGYKIAEAIKEIGAGASCFTDWWGYKYEVVDAIPYAGALMHEAGVLVSFNSDSGELARRMNLEAAKAVKYGGVSETEALKFVTINPAKQLMIDSRVGSIEIGKDADFVIWSGSPLSTETKCLQTWIDGRKYFDIDENKTMNEESIKKRAVIVQKILANPTKISGGGPSKNSHRSERYSCTDETTEGNN
ncbi:MAG: amidohydrolase family protein [Bacteroidota bacterium]